MRQSRLNPGRSCSSAHDKGGPKPPAAVALRRGATGRRKAVSVYASSTMGLARMPILSTSTSTLSPAFIQAGGLRACATPDGVPVAMLTELHRESAATVRKTLVAEFPAGLRAGWHDFTGRWYDDGRLILSSRAAIQFVDR